MAAFNVTEPGWKRYSGQMSRVLPAKSTRVGALDSMIMARVSSILRALQQSQLDGIKRLSPAMTAKNVHGKATSFPLQGELGAASRRMEQINCHRRRRCGCVR